ncbi:MAG: thiamine pyrophosphate-dependent dehydrogenase E1 component subunit alpha [Candidatus Omnitrophota bacterium]
MKMLEKEEVLRMLKMMYKIRFFEERIKRLYKQNLLAGSFLGALHTYVGQEAIAVGICSLLRKDDYILSTHRGHGHFLAKGGSLKELFAEFLGREAGCSKGRGGSMHLFDPEISFLGGNGIVGAGIPIALGTGYAACYRNSDRVTVCFFGDGAASQGTFHESLNIASLWKLPIIFVCENNCYAVTTPVNETIAITNVAERANGYGMPGKVVDGNDLLAVYQEAESAITRARTNKGPTLLECKTYRIDSHCMVLPETRISEEIEKWKEKDPILRFEDRLKKEGMSDQPDFEILKKEVSEELGSAEKFAQGSPFPDPESFRKSIT